MLVTTGPERFITRHNHMQFILEIRSISALHAISFKFMLHYSVNMYDLDFNRQLTDQRQP